MTKLGQQREFDYAKSDRLLFFSVFKENNEFFDSITIFLAFNLLDSENFA
jgi:hypothetical protein